MHINNTKLALKGPINNSEANDESQRSSCIECRGGESGVHAGLDTLAALERTSGKKEKRKA